MDQREDQTCGDYSPAEEERFRRDLQTALELSLQEQTMADIRDALAKTLAADGVDVGKPVGVAKDDPLFAEIRADAERAYEDYIREKLANSSVRGGAIPKKKVLQRQSEGTSWAQRTSSESCRGRQRASLDCADDDVDNIPRRPVGEGAVKKVPRKKRQESDRNGRKEPPHHYSQQDSGRNGRVASSHRLSHRNYERYGRRESSHCFSELESKHSGRGEYSHRLRQLDSSREQSRSFSERDGDCNGRRVSYHFSERDNEYNGREVSSYRLSQQDGERNRGGVTSHSRSQLSASECSHGEVPAEEDSRQVVVSKGSELLQHSVSALPEGQVPDAEDMVPQLQRGKEDNCPSSPISDNEEFLRDLEIACRKSLEENWAPPNKSDTGSPISVNASAVTGTGVVTEQNPEEVEDWLLHAHRYDPQLAKLTRAIKKYLARTGNPDASQPCESCAGKCTCIYVTAEYLDKFGMKEAVCNSCDVQILSTEGSVDFGGDSGRARDSRQELALREREAVTKTEEMVKNNWAAAVEATYDMQCETYEVATTRNDSNSAAFVERWYKSALEEQSSGSEFGASSSAVEWINPETLTGSPLVKYSGIDHDNNNNNMNNNNNIDSSEAEDTNGWKSGAKFGNQELDITGSLSWKTASSVWGPAPEDDLPLRQGSVSPLIELLNQTLPSVQVYSCDWGSDSVSYLSDENSPDTEETDSESVRETDSESVRGVCPDVERID